MSHDPARIRSPGAPDLWLELRPMQALAGQPHIDRGALTIDPLACGQKRGSSPPRPNPIARFRRNWTSFRNWIRAGRHRPAIDIPFTEADRLIEAQLKGMTFPLDETGAFTATVRA